MGALQAAWSAIQASRSLGDERSEESGRAAAPFERTLHAALRIGHDTDTVAAIAGALAGAVWGASVIPERWLAPLHGWPGLNAEELKDLATRAASSQRRSEG